MVLQIDQIWMSLTPEQQNALRQFKKQTADVINKKHDDDYLLKWLKARCYDVNKAEEMFRASMAYREKMKVDSILVDYEPPEVIRRYLTGGICGYDKDGSPVRVELFGLLDMKGLMCSARKSDLEKSKLVQCEGIVRDWSKQSKLLGKKVDGLTVIFDMDRVGMKSLWRPGLQMYLHIVKVMEDNYPEMMKRMFVVNAPAIFPILWKICRPLISEDMKKKIHVLGSDHKAVLCKYIDADQLPKYLGGDQTDLDGNPRCATKICQGGEIPRSYYFSETTETENMETVSVPKGDKLIIDFEVEKPSSILRWEFRADDYDIAFGVIRLRDDKQEEVVATKRYNCHHVTEDNSVICEEPGTYAIVFDNSYSWTRAKSVHYLIELHTCDDVSEVDEITSGGSWTRLVKGKQITHL